MTGRIVPLLLLMAASSAGAQPPPLHVVEGTMSRGERGPHTLIVATVDGAEHVYRVARDLVVHTPSGPSGLESLREGTHVVVHFSVDAVGATAHEIDRIDHEGLAMTEGIVLDINHRKRQVRLRLADGRVEKLRLTTRAAAEHAAASPDEPIRVIVYYTQERREKVIHYFRKK